MAAPKRIDELTAVTSLSAAAAVAIVQGGQTLRTTPQAFITEAESYTASGNGAIARTLQGKAREWVSLLDFIPESLHAGIAAGTDTTDLSAYVASAIATNRIIYAPKGTYNVDTVDFLATSTAMLGRGLIGESARGTIFKARSGATKLLQVYGSGVNNQDNVFKNFTLDVTNITDDTSGYAIWMKDTWGNHFEKIYVTGNGSNKWSLYCIDGVYTSTFLNCDFGSTTGKIGLQGASLGDAVTTLTFIGCAFGKVDADNCVSITFVQPIVQGSLDKFDLASINGFHISGGDIEGTGTYLVLGSSVSHLFSLGNQFSGFSGTYSSGSFNGGALLDVYGSTNMQVYPVDGQQLQVTGILAAKRTNNGLVRHILGNPSNGASRRVDLQIMTNDSATEALFMGVDQAASYKGYLDNRSGGRFEIQHSGTGRIGVDGTGIGFFGAAPVAQQTGVAVTAAAIHAALVNLGLITA